MRLTPYVNRMPSTTGRTRSSSLLSRLRVAASTAAVAAPVTAVPLYFQRDSGHLGTQPGRHDDDRQLPGERRDQGRAPPSKSASCATGATTPKQCSPPRCTTMRPMPMTVARRCPSPAPDHCCSGSHLRSPPAFNAGYSATPHCRDNSRGPLRLQGASNVRSGERDLSHALALDEAKVPVDLGERCKQSAVPLCCCDSYVPGHQNRSEVR
jgi:hypothetical protein